ncbi:NGG1p interacting factor NIF3 [bacterium (Candidatus Blackallbacteria) CG17_big_fil_post_rev_8_21_14_2_50_48_46]|uniref:NGG1p interacting factor NIF3 n=1 Tax=bacterium (Candidatus Blackallbacteria) CG17_big_fil_post_rev_8_21_14_2_50_48_46 TaxID=2014261 RepID=A0A2M7G4T4_9BACT|nr:MAG: NGG1p interacting factor NIF3 [bacterium (Candidatus Blackallbacteria) CG18_big_fil_WC_8_21_14_2_50_49_26]PIW16780.1 MAG: NGG1p interacting factor NIF3 [bacterium (Candidatus Blackallbacteria) CG17_big_fil_post_rev_8_21_14_2_50_48_46]PIW47076.1 MAG: NGG1p interacting factor NIF3 [bacterium (Candidatus Blackallbacteria) CG13_big_fil_rev_8_21_14_2_50_49_14]
MKLWDIYKFSVELGIQTDPRGPEAVAQELERRCKAFDQLSAAEKEWFDTDQLTNPYPDTRILQGAVDREIKHLFVGIDIGVSELLLVDRLNQKGTGIDAVMAHHPEGLALTTLHQAMDLQTDIFHGHGVPINVADQILQREADKTHFEISVGNYNRVVDAARLLELPMLTSHTTTDNLVQHYIEQKIASAQPRLISEIMELLSHEPEYNEARKLEAGPRLLSGSPDNRCGKIMVDMTGGTDAGTEIYEKLGQAGIGTIVAMHLSPGVREVLEKAHVNIVLAGHMSSDSLGLNLFMDQLEARGLKITAGSGFTRFKRDPETRKLLS